MKTKLQRIAKIEYDQLTLDVAKKLIDDIAKQIKKFNAKITKTEVFEKPFVESGGSFMSLPVEGSARFGFIEFQSEWFGYGGGTIYLGQTTSYGSLKLEGSSGSAVVGTLFGKLKNDKAIWEKKPSQNSMLALAQVLNGKNPESDDAKLEAFLKKLYVMVNDWDLKFVEKMVKDKSSRVYPWKLELTSLASKNLKIIEIEVKKQVRDVVIGEDGINFRTKKDMMKVNDLLRLASKSINFHDFSFIKKDGNKVVAKCRISYPKILGDAKNAFNKYKSKIKSSFKKEGGVKDVKFLKFRGKYLDMELDIVDEIEVEMTLGK